MPVAGTLGEWAASPKRVPATPGSARPTSLRDAAALWRELASQHGLEAGGRDNDLLKRLRVRLWLGDGDFATALAAHGVSVEDLLAACFTEVSPYFEMLGDLLEFFERAGITSTRQNAGIEYDFGKQPPLRFDLKHFREWLKRWRTAQTHRYRVEADALWALLRLLRSHVSATAPSQAAAEWLDKYRRGEWPRGFPKFEPSGNQRADSAMSRTWDFVAWTVAALRGAGVPPYYGFNSLTSEQRADLFRKGGPLVAAENDVWTGHALEALSTVVELLRSDDARAAVVGQDLESWWQEMPRESSARRVANLHAILSLPLWSKRHELYSAWLLTQIVGAVPSDAWEIHHTGGILQFRFQPTRFATLWNQNPPIGVWGELRSAYQSANRKGRKNNIQPDYTVIAETGPKPKPEVMLVVECKQYLRASTSNFAAALSDYASGYPRATVVLADYGGLKAAPILHGIADPSVRHRCKPMGQVYPGGPGQLAFQRTAAQIMAGHRPRASGHGLPEAIELAWQAPLGDLDLWVLIDMGESRYAIGHSSPGNVSEVPYAELESDLRQPGTETVRIGQWLPGTYTVFVHNFSKAPPIAGSRARLSFTLGSREQQLVAPAQGVGVWWKALEIDAARESLTILAELSNEDPRPGHSGAA